MRLINKINYLDLGFLFFFYNDHRSIIGVILILFKNNL